MHSIILLLLFFSTTYIEALSITIEPHATSKHFVKIDDAARKVFSWNENHSYFGINFKQNSYELNANTFKNSWGNRTETVSIGYSFKKKYFNIVPAVGYQIGYVNTSDFFGLLWFEKELDFGYLRATVTDKAVLLKVGIEVF